jgi:predicted Zn finger-like uncharacterized protein
MFTQCPHCSTVFRIYAEQLTQAHGQVRCGICEGSFNALESLSEYRDGFAASTAMRGDMAASAKQAAQVKQTPAPEQSTAPKPSSKVEQVTGATTITAAAEAIEEVEHVDHEARPAAEQHVAREPSFEPQHAATAPAAYATAEADRPEEPAPLNPIEPETTDLTTPWEDAAVSLRATRDDDTETAPAAKVIAEETGVAAASTATAPANESLAPPSTQTERALPDLGIIAAEPRRISATEAPRGWLKTTVWAVTNVALIMVLLGQYTYFNRNTLSQYPQLRPWLTGFCAVFSCNTPLPRDVSQIKLTSRVVQSHPKRANALLIDATLLNDADFRQAYPLVELRFSDLNNHLVAGRRFRPSEYLPANTSVQAGMPPHQPVHITLEIVDPGKQAVSFQFELL